MPQFCLKTLCFHDDFSNIVHGWAKQCTLITFPSFTFIILLELKIACLTPALMFFELMNVTPHLHSRNSKKCLIITFSCDHSFHLTLACFISLNTCLVETSDLWLKYDLSSLYAYSPIITRDTSFCLWYFQLSTMLCLLFPGSQFFYVVLFLCFDRNHPHTASWIKDSGESNFLFLKSLKILFFFSMC